MQIRPACLADAESIARVHVASWRAGYAGLLPADVLAALSVGDWTERRRASLAVGARVLLATATGLPGAATAEPAVAGFAAFGPRRSDPDGSTDGELYALYVEPTHWGTGVGTALISSAVTELDAEHPRAILWVLRENDRARQFYAARGWRADGAHKVDVGPGGAVLDEIRYCRERGPNGG